MPDPNPIVAAADAVVEAVLEPSAKGAQVAAPKSAKASTAPTPKSTSESASSEKWVSYVVFGAGALAFLYFLGKRRKARLEKDDELNKPLPEKKVPRTPYDY